MRLQNIENKFEKLLIFNVNTHIISYIEYMDWCSNFSYKTIKKKIIYIVYSIYYWAALAAKLSPKQIDITINIIEIDFLFWLYLNKFLYTILSNKVGPPSTYFEHHHQTKKEEENNIKLCRRWYYSSYSCNENLMKSITDYPTGHWRKTCPP